MQRFQYLQKTSMVELPRALCPNDVVVFISAAFASRSKASEANSGASSECRTSGAPKVKTILSRKGCNQVEACRSLRGMSTTYLDVGSMRARSSVMPDFEVPCPWKSMHHLARGA